MAFLTESELKSTYYPEAVNMPTGDISKYLARANGYVFGQIGGTPPAITGDDGSGLKTAVAMAFEIFAAGETQSVDPTNGNVTEGAPTSAYSKQKRALESVNTMLRPYKTAYENANAAETDKGIIWLGGL